MAKGIAREHPSWCGLARQLDLTYLVIIIIFGIAVSVVEHHDPVQRPVFMYDATISYKFVGNHEVPFWVALVVPFLVLVATAVAVEFLYIKQGWRRATISFVNVILSALAAVAVVGFLTELFKRLCGRIRPDFLDRCQPQTVNGVTYQYGQFPNIQCSDVNGKYLPDGHMSFPSGHSSCSLTFGLYSALYLLWCVFHRDNGAHCAKLLQPANASWAAKLQGELISVCVILLVLFDIAWPWGIAASRFRDNRHNVSDVVAGLLLGACFVPVFIVRLVSSSKQWTAYYDQLSADMDRVLPVTASQADNTLLNMHTIVQSISPGHKGVEMVASSQIPL